MSSTVKEATDFLAPVFDKDQLHSVREHSIILRLAKPLTPTTDTTLARSIVIKHALGLIRRIHDELYQRDFAANAVRLERPGERRTIFALLDLLILEGIYPALSPGVGIPIERRARSFVVPSQVPVAVGRVQEVDTGDAELLRAIIKEVSHILRSAENKDVTSVGKTNEPWSRGYKGVEGMVRERCLVDLLAGCGELAFNPDLAQDSQSEWKTEFSTLIEGIPTGALMPLLISLIHPTSPPWFRQPVTRCLSRLPISRPHAVQSILELFLSSSAGNGSSQPPGQLSTDALSKASRLLSAVPKGITPDAFFSKVCPQLLDILHSADSGMAKAAAYIIAELLGQRGKDVEKVIEAQIVHDFVVKFNPEPSPAPPPPPAQTQQPLEQPRRNVQTSSALLDLEDTPEAPAPPSRAPLVFEIPDETFTPIKLERVEHKALVSEAALSSALRSLELLLAAHPSPLVSERIISKILVPLWALLGYAKETGRSAWYDRVSGILKSYFAVSLDLNLLQHLQENLTSTGGESWNFGPGSSGGIEIRAISTHDSAGVTMELIDARVEEFLNILNIDTVKSTLLTDYFLSIFRTWLARGTEIAPLKMLITVKILQEVLNTHGESLAKKPTEILQIISSILDDYINHASTSAPTAPATTQPPSLNTLRNLVTSLPDHDDGDGEDPHTARTETAAMALSLLSVLVSSPDTQLTDSDTRLLHSLHPALTALSTPTTDPSLRTLATNLLPLLPLHTATTSTPTPLATQQRQSYLTALSYLSDPLIPVRAHGLHLLRALILERAPIIDITATTRLLIGLVKDGDSYVYLNVVKCLSALTDRHSATVTKMLVQAYLDDEDTLGLKTHDSNPQPLSLDERLKIGEALLGTVQRLGTALVGETAAAVADAMITIVSRRRTRPGAEEDVKPSPSTPDDDEEDEDELDEKTGLPLTPTQKAQRDHHHTIVSGWHTAAAEDTRLRTSALSILGAAIETNPLGLSTPVLREALDISLSILTLETKAPQGILRRAAVVCIGGVLGGVVKDEGWNGVVWEVVRGKRGEVRRCLGYVRHTDCDGLVREQAGVVVGNLEAVEERAVVGGRGEWRDEGGEGWRVRI